MKNITSYILEANTVKLSVNADAAETLAILLDYLISDPDECSAIIEKLKKDKGEQKYALMLAEFTNALDKNS